MNQPYNDMYKYVSRKTFFASLIMVCAFSLLCTLSVLFYSKSKLYNDSDKTYSPEYVYASAPVSAYILTNSNGYIAVCDYSDLSLIEVLDICVSDLSNDTQQSLESGVYVASLSELISTVKEYTN
ncbi:MAG: hypothetical protein E7635_00380 [Ruminococcaceae bacterium]|nr:hypothetical protein [Oscillospiraceae bacterium]